jgi:nicotinamidase-related amidase
MKTALLVIDVQMALAHLDSEGEPRSCPQAEQNIARLMEKFRSNNDPVIHIHYHGADLDDPFHPSLPGSVVQPIAAPRAGEPIVIKTRSSGFMGTNLEDILTEQGIEQLVLCGATANHCVESTTRTAGDLGYQPIYVADATWTYGLTGPDGVTHSAEQIHSVSIATLQGEIASVQNTDVLLSTL